MTLPANQILVSITELDHDARGLGFLPDSLFPHTRGMAVFVRGALPGQTVICTPLLVKLSFIEAELVEVVEDFSPKAPLLCAHQHECGGCPLQPMPYQSQLAWKDKLARQTMRRIGNFDLKDLDAIWQQPVPSPQITNYRNKVTFAFGKDSEGNIAIGLRKAGSHKVCPISHCALLDGSADKILEAVNKFASTAGNFWKSLTLRRALLPHTLQPAWWLALTTAREPRLRAFTADIGHKILAHLPTVASFIHEEQNGSTKRIASLGEAYTPEIMVLPLMDRIFELDAMSFFQVNNAASTLLANIVNEMAEWGSEKSSKNSLLDIYCGVGAPGQLLAHKFSRILGIERDYKAVELAKKNALSYGLDNCHYLAGDAAEVLKTFTSKERRHWHTVLADPPRAGIDSKTMAVIKQIAPQKIIYVSCNPATLARDGAHLKKDYRLQKLVPIDMFPHTAHLEICSLWVKRGSV